MPRLRFLADEHVPRVFTGALRSNGFEVERAQQRYGQQTDDRSVLDDCAAAGYVIITNDRDFVRLADDTDHGGIIVYTDRRLLLDSPLDAVEAVARLDRHYDRTGVRDVVEWLDNWV